MERCRTQQGILNLVKLALYRECQNAGNKQSKDGQNDLRVSLPHRELSDLQKSVDFRMRNLIQSQSFPLRLGG
jgi:hypothetical protein